MNELAEAEALIAEARSCLQHGAPVKAESLLVTAIRQLRQAYGENAPELLVPLNLYARARGKQRAWDSLPVEEREALETALRIATAAYGEQAAQTIEIREVLAAALHASGDSVAAVDHMSAVVRAKEARHGEGPVLAHALNGLADIYLRSHLLTEAVEAYTRSLAMQGEVNEMVEFLTLFGRGRALLELGRRDEALVDLARAHSWLVHKYGPTNPRTTEVGDWVERARTSGEPTE